MVVAELWEASAAVLVPTKVTVALVAADVAIEEAGADAAATVALPNVLLSNEFETAVAVAETENVWDCVAEGVTVTKTVVWSVTVAVLLSSDDATAENTGVAEAGAELSADWSKARPMRRRV